MKDLVALVIHILNRKLILPFTLPAWIAYIGAGVFDLLAKVTGKKFAISKIRVKKFESQTVFDASKMLDLGFLPPFAMRDAFERTIKHEFINNA